MKLAIVTEDWPCTTGGGVAALTRTLADALHVEGEQVEVWTRGGGARDAALAGEDPPYPVHAVPGRSWRTRGAAHWARALPGLRRRFRPDAILASTWVPLAAADLGPVAVFAHGRDITGDPGADRRGARARVLAAPHRWLCLTRWMRSRLTEAGVAAGRITIVPAAVAAPSPRPRRPEAGRVLCVGRLVPRKGQDLLIEAVARRPGLRLDVVGEGPDRLRLQARGVELGVADRVTLHGFLPGSRLEELWSRAAVFALPAREEAGGDTEGYGLVFLEAAARGLPAVGGRTAGAAEAILPGETGLLVDDPRDPEALADALVAAQDERLGDAGRRRYLAEHQPRHLARAVHAALEGP